MDNIIPVFRQWVPEWLIKVTLFLVIIPSLILFFLPLANINAAAGYYGCEPADVQFSVALFYAGYTGFYCLERRFFSFLASKEYFIIFTCLQILTAFCCYHITTVAVLFPFRFIQGMAYASMVNLSLTLMFNRLSNERAREISFSIFFGLLLCALPFNNLITADIIDAFNFNALYKCAVFAYLPGLVLILLIMNTVRLQVKKPLYQLDWQSFVLYTVLLCLIGYIMLYGQQYYWLQDARIRYSVVAIVVLGIFYVVRQLYIKRPYTNLSVFSYRNFKIGILVLFIMYICRFASGISNNFFTTILKLDPRHLSYLNLFNIVGLIAGVVIACSMILQKKNARYIWLTGFLILLVFHVRMFFLFSMQANESNFYLPLMLQGLGVGLIMVPAIVYTISSVPVHMGPSAAGICLAVRYLGYCSSTALINYFELFGKSSHYNAFRDQVTGTNAVVKQAVAREAQYITSAGANHTLIKKFPYRLLVQRMSEQSQLRFAMDYYELMSCVLVATILLIALFPYLNRTVVYLRSQKLSPA
ncbi:MAG: beta-carotene 15,15'-monooxygenase [Chitinophagaceae bacterium]